MMEPKSLKIRGLDRPHLRSGSVRPGRRSGPGVSIGGLFRSRTTDRRRRPLEPCMMPKTIEVEGALAWS